MFMPRISESVKNKKIKNNTHTYIEPLPTSRRFKKIHVSKIHHLPLTATVFVTEGGQNRITLCLGLLTKTPLVN